MIATLQKIQTTSNLFTSSALKELRSLSLTSAKCVKTGLNSVAKQFLQEINQP